MTSIAFGLMAFGFSLLVVGLVRMAAPKIADAVSALYLSALVALSLHPNGPFEGAGE